MSKLGAVIAITAILLGLMAGFAVTIFILIILANLASVYLGSWAATAVLITGLCFVASCYIVWIDE